MIYSGMDKDERNQIIEERCQELGISPNYDADENAGYIPSLEDKIQFPDYCDDPVTKEIRGNALMEMMGDPFGDDSWTEVL